MNKGFSLIELLICLVIISVGAISVAKMNVQNIKNTASLSRYSTAITMAASSPLIPPPIGTTTVMNGEFTQTITVTDAGHHTRHMLTAISWEHNGLTKTSEISTLYAVNVPAYVNKPLVTLPTKLFCIPEDDSDDEDDDGDNGHGNDDDGVDESNPGKSKESSEDDDNIDDDNEESDDDDTGSCGGADEDDDGEDEDDDNNEDEDDD